MLLTAKTSIPSTTAASSAFCLGKIIPSKPSSFACIAIGNAPFIGRSEPSSDNSPIIINLWSCSEFTCSEAAKIPIAIGKS